MLVMFVAEAELWNIVNSNQLETNQNWDVIIGGGYAGGSGTTLFGQGANIGDIQMRGDLIIDGNILSVSDLNITGNNLPSLDNTYTIGNRTLRWSQGHFNALFVNDWSNVSIISSQVSGLAAGMDYINLVLSNDSSTLNSLWDIANYTAGAGISISSHAVTNTNPMAYTNLALINNSNTFSGGANYFTGGNVGIGTTAPSALLEVVGTSGNLLNISNGSDSHLVVNNQARVSIGTSDSNGTLHISQPTAMNEPNIVLTTYAGGSGTIIEGRHARGTRDAPTAAAIDFYLLSLDGTGYDGGGFTSRRARIALAAAENWNTSDQGTNIKFYTTPLKSSTMAEVMRISTTGNVGIGTTTPGSRLEIENTASADDVLLLEDSSGLCEAQPTTTGLTWSCSSDIRLKENIKDASSILPFFNGFKIRDYTVKKTGEQAIGVIAQEVQEKYPELVNIGDDGYLQVSEPNPWMYVKAIQELTARVEQLEGRECKQ